MGYRTISLFSGCGGLDLGAEEAGAEVRACLEWDRTACETLSANFHAEVLNRDIRTTSSEELLNAARVEPGDYELLIGGPPCTPFSKSGYWLDYKREGRDPDASLLQDYTRVLAETRPKAFLLENVYGLAYKNRRTTLERLLREITEAGYVHNVNLESVAPSCVINAADYGVPQLRQRLIILGLRKDVARSQPIRLPEATHQGPHERRKAVGSLPPHITAGEAIGDLACRHDLAEPTESVNGKWGHLLPAIPPGENYLHFTDRGGGESLFEWRSRYWTFLLKLDPARPSSTIQANPGPYVGPFHWDNRRLRTLELQRLMGFVTDTYGLAGDRRSIQRQLGNAVPPLLAKQMVGHLLGYIS